MDKPIIFILGITILFIVISAFIIFVILTYNRRALSHQQELRQKENEKKIAMLSATIEAQEVERKRIGADVHDDIGPLLSTLKLQIHKFKYCNTDTSVTDQIKLVNKQVDEVVENVRHLARDLVPSVLVEFGLIAAMENLCERITYSGQIEAKVQSNIKELQIPQKTELTLYRIAQELCNNAIKHAEANVLIVHFNKEGEQLEICIEDNGKGIPISKVKNEDKKGFGLQNIHARAEFINAKFQIEGIEGEGTKATIRVPIYSIETKLVS